LKPLNKDQLKKLETLPGGERLVICKGYAIPTGWVIIGEIPSTSCPGSFPNAWVIKQPGLTEVVCKVSPIPSNYVRIGEGPSTSCPGHFPNAWTIHRV